MSAYESSSSESSHYFIPICLISVALSTLFIFQIITSVQAQQNLQLQFSQRTQIVEKALKVQGDLERLVTDLLDLAETNSTAKTIVDKYQIKRNQPPVE